MRLIKYTLACFLALGLSAASTTSMAAPVSLGTLSPGGSLDFGSRVTGDPVTELFAFELDANGSSVAENELLFLISSANVANVKGRLFAGTPGTFEMRSGTVSATSVPIPAAAVLFGSALLGFAGFATRRRVS